MGQGGGAGTEYLRLDHHGDKIHHRVGVVQSVHRKSYKENDSYKTARPLLEFYSLAIQEAHLQQGGGGRGGDLSGGVGGQGPGLYDSTTTGRRGPS